MKKNMNKVVVSLAVLILLAACNGQGTNSSAQAKNITANLDGFIQPLDLLQLDKNANSTQQFKFMLPDKVVLDTMELQMFTDSSCKDSGQIISFKGDGKSYPAGRYTTSNGGLYYACGSLFGSCEKELDSIKSLRYVFRFNDSFSSSGCMTAPMADWDTGSAVACTKGSSCGYAEPWQMSIYTEPTIEIAGGSNPSMLEGNVNIFTAELSAGNKTDKQIVSIANIEELTEHNISVTPAECTLSAETPSCIFVVSSPWGTNSRVNTINFSSSDGAKLVQSRLPIVQPAVFLQASTDVKSEHATIGGITWATQYEEGGEVNPRYTVDYDSEHQVVNDNLTSLSWMVRPNRFDQRFYTYSEALEFIKKQNDSGYCEHNDWRLPTVTELKSLVNYDAALYYADGGGVSKMNNLADYLSLLGFSETPDGANYFYWTSTINMTNSEGNLWVVSMFDGSTGSRNGSLGVSLWAVRDNKSSK